MAQAQQVSATKKPSNDMKLFASLERKIFVPLTGDPSDPEKVYNTLREAGARVALHRIESIIAGKEENVRGFEVLTVTGHAAPSQPQQRRRTREYEPSGDEVKSIKRGTTYAKLMEMMVEGATMEEMLKVTNNSTPGGVNDVIGWQVRQRGYGISFDKGTGKFKIVFPKGVKELLYQD